MRRTDEAEQDARLLARALATLQKHDGGATFAELCAALGCAGVAGGDRDQRIADGSARRDRERLRRVLQRAEHEGIVARDGERLRLALA